MQDLNWQAGDLHVIVTGNEYVGIVHPCKIYNVLVVNRAFLYIGPEESHICDITCRAGPDAYVSAHGDVDGVVANILHAMQRLRTESPATSEVGKQFTKEMLIPKMIFAIEQTRKISARATLSAVRADRA